MRVLFLYPEKLAGTKVYAKNVILAIMKYYSDLEILEYEYSEFNTKKGYVKNNATIIDTCINKKIDLVHIEFDFGYFGFNYGNKPFIDLIKEIKYRNIKYTISIHNSSEVFLEGMSILGKDTKKFNQILSFLKKENPSHLIVHNPLFLGYFAPLLPVTEVNNDFNERINFKNKSQIVLGLSGFLHKAKNYDEFLKFAKKNKRLFIEQNIIVNAQFNVRMDRVSQDRLEYQKLIEKYIDSHINIKIIEENLERYLSFLKTIDVGISTHKVLSQSGTITDYIYMGKPVIARENTNLLYLDFILMYNNEDYLYYFIQNIREILSKYNINQQKAFCEMFDSEFVAMNYRLAFIKNKLGTFNYRKAVGGFCYYNDKLILFKKHKIPFFDIVHGGVENAESDIETLSREITEELGINIEDFVIQEKITDFEYPKSIKTQIKVSNAGAKMQVYAVKLNKLPRLPTEEIESYAEYTDDLLVYQNTKRLIEYVKKK